MNFAKECIHLDILNKQHTHLYFICGGKDEKVGVKLRLII